MFEAREKKIKELGLKEQSSSPRKLKKQELSSFIKRNYHDIQNKKRKDSKSSSPFKFRPSIDSHSKEIANEVKKKRNKDVFNSLFDQATRKREKMSETVADEKQKREE